MSQHKNLYYEVDGVVSVIAVAVAVIIVVTIAL